jgi:hypothetical protein
MVLAPLICPLSRAHVQAEAADLGLKYAAASAHFVFGAIGDDPAAATDAVAVTGEMLRRWWWRLRWTERRAPRRGGYAW